MRRGGVLFLLLIIGLIAFSFYRGYLTLSSQQQPTNNNTEIKLIVDQNKAKADVQHAGEEVRKATEKIDLKPGD
ncbi:hypothetical protein [Anatilimnocola floriformis]|uniref:hypothetical protein n=1 Tax=Anatilimnocola floriformis TaxID=2948575 RepID=UPI0020C4B0AF|nr:hypothetical protein [Anatilimnocola floriformis]